MIIDTKHNTTKYKFKKFTNEKNDLLEENSDIKTNIAFIINKFGIPTTTIEIGIYYGLTTLWLAEKLSPLNPNFKHYCIDPFTQDIAFGEDLTDVHNDFLYNLQACEAKENIVFINKSSYEGLIDLKNKNIIPQFVYIDGDHKASSVLTDLVFSFNLLPSGGVILCDDALDWRHVDTNGSVDPHMCPRMAVETFLMCNWSSVRPLRLPCDSQKAFVKI